jgi:hypothetical protein
MKHVNPSAVRVWQITNSIAASIVLLVTTGIWLLKYFYFDWIPMWVIYILLVEVAVQVIWFVLIEPVITYRKYRYDIKDDELIIQQGVFINKTSIIPFTRIQNVETTVGPIMKRYGLKTVDITTAGGGASIHLIDDDEAEQIKHDIAQVVKRLERRRWQ